MKLDRLAKQIRRDAAANPKKAVALGLMLLVALYFWAPLVWRWVAGHTGKKPVRTENASLILTDDPVEPTGQAQGKSGGKFRWEKIRHLIRSDPHMVTATFDSTWIDPFAGRDPPPETAPTLTTGEAAAPAALGPREAGLALTSVAIGPRRRAAIISGDTYHEGEVVVVGGKDNAAAGIEFRVVKISPLGVELERSGRTFVLELSRPKLGQGDEIGRTKAKARD